MTKLNLFLVAMTLAGASQANVRDYKIAVNEVGKEIEIKFETTKMQTEMCTFDILQLRLADVHEGFGVIELQVAVKPGKVCLSSVGPTRGMVVFQRGEVFPSLSPREYKLVINKQAQGSVWVTKNGVEFHVPLAQ